MQIWEMPSYNEVQDRKRGHDWDSAKQEDEFMLAKNRWILDRADWYIENAEATEMDVWLFEASYRPMLDFIKTHRKDPLEASVRLQNAVYAIALKRAKEDAEDRDEQDILMGVVSL